MDPVLADEPQMAELVALSKKKGSELSPIKKYLDRHPDLLHGIHFQETDVDVVIGIIMRFLHDTIFQRVLYGIVGHLVLSVGFLESSMQSNVEPRRGKPAVRTSLATYEALTQPEQTSLPYATGWPRPTTPSSALRSSDRNEVKG